MQRILRDEGYALADPQQPARRQALIHRHCPPSIGNLFATPREGRGGNVEWWTELPGQPRRLDDLTEAEQATLQKQTSQRLLALGNLITELERRGAPAAAELRKLPTAATPDTLYSIGGEPLLIRWVPTVPVPAPAPAAVAATPRVPVPPPSPVTRPRRGWVIPLLLLLVSVLALLGLWLGFTHWERFSLPWPQSQRPVEPLTAQDRAEPVLGTGDVQVTLRWNSNDDLDLAVSDPNGDTASFSNPYIPSGGQLDVDSNADCTSISQNPVENLFWNSGNTPEGGYIATVSLFTRCNGDRDPIPFELSITLNGNTETQTGTVNDQSPSQSFEFVFP